MNLLINNQQAYYSQDEDLDEKETTGEVMAISIISLLIISIFVISGWSTISYLTGNISSGGPIGLVYNLLQSTGIV